MVYFRGYLSQQLYFEARYYSNVQGRFTSADEFTGGLDELYDFAGVAADNPAFTLRLLTRSR